MFCKECGCKLDDGSDFCPNCGKKIERSAERAQAEDISIMKTADEKSVAITANDENRTQPADARKIEPKGVNGLAIAGFVVSLLSLGLGYFYAIASVIGLILSAVSMGMRKKYASCNGLGIAGLVIGIISTVIWLIVWLYTIILILAFTSIGRAA